MKICVFTDSFFPYISGVTTSIANRVNELASRGHEISIFRPRPSSEDQKEMEKDLHEAIQVFDLTPSLPRRSIPDLDIVIPTFLPALKIARRQGPQLIHIETQWGVGWQGCITAKVLRVPLVGSFHTFWADPEYLKYFPFPAGKLTTRIMWKYTIFFFNRCTKVLCPSGVMKQQLMHHGLRSQPKVLRNSIQLPDIPCKEEIGRLRHGHQLDKGPHFIFIGRISHEKSLDVALQAFATIADDYPETNFVLIGTGNAVEPLKQQAMDLGIREKIVFLGQVPNARLIDQSLPCMGDVFLTASTTENQPVSILEAMSFGLPIIGPAARGIPELVRHKETGLLFEPHDPEDLGQKMRYIIDNPGERENFSQNALNEASRYSVESTADKIEQIYSALIDET